MPIKKSFCNLCSAFCGTIVTVEDNKVIKVTGDKDNPVTKGYICSLAKKGYDQYLDLSERITTPLKRVNGELVPASLNEVLTEIVEKIKSMPTRHSLYGFSGRQYGAETLLNALLKDVSNDIFEYGPPSWEKSAVFITAHFFPTSFTVSEEEADTIFCVGKNLWESGSTPRAKTLVNDAKRNDKVLISVDPVATKAAKNSTLHLQVRPGTDVWFISALIKQLIISKKVDTKWLTSDPSIPFFCKRILQQVNIQEFLSVCNISQEQLNETVRLLTNAKTLSVCLDLGINHSINQLASTILLSMLQGMLGHRKNVHSNEDMVIEGLNRHSHSITLPISKKHVATGTVPVQDLATEAEHFNILVLDTIDPLGHGINLAETKKQLEKVPLKIVFENVLTESAKIADYVIPSSCAIVYSEVTNPISKSRMMNLSEPLVDAPEYLQKKEDIVSTLASMLLPNINEISDKVLHYVKLLQTDKIQFLFEILTESDFAQQYIIHQVSKEVFNSPWALLTWVKLVLTYTRTDNPHSNLQVLNLQKPLINELYKSVQHLVNYKSVRLPENILPNITTPHDFSWIQKISLFDFDTSKLVNNEYPLILCCGYRKVDHHPLAREFLDKIVEVFPKDAEKYNITEGEKVKVSTDAGSLDLTCVINEDLQENYVRVPIFPGVNHLLSTSNIRQGKELNPTFKFQFAKIEKINGN